MTCIQTYTGIKFDLVNPKPEMVSPVDIAHALGRLCRFTGHTEPLFRRPALRRGVAPGPLRACPGWIAARCGEGPMWETSAPPEGPASGLPGDREWKVWLAIAERFNVNPDDIHLVKGCGPGCPEGRDEALSEWRREWVDRSRPSLADPPPNPGIQVTSPLGPTPPSRQNAHRARCLAAWACPLGLSTGIRTPRLAPSSPR